MEEEIEQYKRNSFTDVPNGKYTDCSGCPCLVVRDSNKAGCNLNYKTSKSFIAINSEYLSRDCGLERIIYKKNKGQIIFNPKTIEIIGD
jgi:hypothetical protein